MTQLFVDAPWFDVFSQIVLILLGAALVFFTNLWAERRRDIRDEDLRRRREASIFTGIFSVRNLLATELRLDDKSEFDRARIPILKAGQRNLHSLIEKSEPSSQGFVASLFEISLRLDVLITVADTSDDQLTEKNEAFANAFNELLGALDMFDVMAHSSLDFISDEELANFPFADENAEPPGSSSN